MEVTIMNIWRLNGGKKMTYPLADLTDTKEFTVTGQYENHPFLKDGTQDINTVSGITLLVDDRDGGMKQSFFVSINDVTTLPFAEEELKNVKVSLVNPIYQYKVNKNKKLDMDIFAEDYTIAD